MSKQTAAPIVKLLLRSGFSVVLFLLVVQTKPFAPGELIQGKRSLMRARPSLLAKPLDWQEQKGTASDAPAPMSPTLPTTTFKNNEPQSCR
jgi:hypothetical protein